MVLTKIRIKATVPSMHLTLVLIPALLVKIPIVRKTADEIKLKVQAS
jgi:hypothetical protein